MAKDLFSAQAADYAKYRPHYPPDLFQYILQFVEAKDCAWDCATGNGQVAVALSPHFKTIEATDLSEAQLNEATPRPNIHYRLSKAEQTLFADNSFDLVTVGTAYHWFDWAAFHAEATRVGKPGAVVAAWAYHIVYSSDEKLTALVNHFYNDIIKRYWDAERRYVEDRYITVDFAFEPLPAKEFDLQVQWSKEDFLGYLRTWSAVQHYIRQHEESPLNLITANLQQAWPDEAERQFHFPLFMRIGRVRK